MTLKEFLKKTNCKEENMMMEYSGEEALKKVKQNGWAIQYINNPTEEMMLEAVKQDGLAIQYIHNPTEEMMLEAVKQNGYAIKYIKKSSFEVETKEYTIAELEELLGSKIKIVKEEK